MSERVEVLKSMGAAIEMWSRGDYRQTAADHQIMSERLCERLCITPAHHVLDVACGTGNSAIAAARRRAAEVVGLDMTPALLDQGRRRAEAEGVSNIRFVEGDARILPFDDASFDIVLSTIGATFLPDQEATAQELMRVTRPGGKIGLTVFCRQSLPSDVYNLTAELVPPPPGSGPPAYTWSDGPRAHELLGSGCTSIDLIADSYDVCFPSAEAFLDHNLTYYGPVMTRFAQLPDSKKTVYRQRSIEAMNNYNRATDGTLVAQFDYMTIIATRNNREVLQS